MTWFKAVFSTNSDVSWMRFGCQQLLIAAIVGFFMDKSPVLVLGLAGLAIGGKIGQNITESKTP